MGGGDRLSGGAGEDDLEGSNGPNRIDPGPGRDTVDGGGGSDPVLARDSDTDVVDCGGGADGSELDRLDFFFLNREGAAFAVFIGFTNAFGRHLSVEAREGAALVGLGCPPDGPSPCNGTAELLEGPRRLGSATFSLKPRPQHWEPVKIPLAACDFARASTREGLSATLVVQTTDSAGVAQEQRTAVGVAGVCGLRTCQ